MNNQIQIKTRFWNLSPKWDNIPLMFLKVPRKANVEKAARVKEREALEMQKKNQSYKLLSDDDEDADSYSVPVKVSKRKLLEI